MLSIHVSSKLVRSEFSRPALPVPKQLGSATLLVAPFAPLSLSLYACIRFLAVLPCPPILMNCSRTMSLTTQERRNPLHPQS